MGKTLDRESDVVGIRLPAGASRADHEAKLTQVREENRSETVHPAEEICSREVMRTAGRQPRILLTNPRLLKLLLTRQRDVEPPGSPRRGTRLSFCQGKIVPILSFHGASRREPARLVREGVLWFRRPSGWKSRPGRRRSAG